MANKVGKNVIDFLTGHPHNSLLLPSKLMQKAMTIHTHKENEDYYIESTQYSILQGSW